MDSKTSGAGASTKVAPPRLSLRRAPSTSASALSRACVILGWQARRAGREAASAEFQYLSRDAEAAAVLADAGRRRRGVALSRMPGAHAVCAKLATAAALGLASRLCAGGGALLIREGWPDSYALGPDGTGAGAEALRCAMGETKGKHWWIVKPDRASQGDGIFLTQSWEAIHARLNGCPVLVQRYEADTALLDERKFDLRVYVLLTRNSAGVLRAYACREGICRLCAESYSKPEAGNAHQLTAHLTNYAINKGAEGFERAADMGEGSKRALMTVLMQLVGDEAAADKLFDRITALLGAAVAAMEHPMASEPPEGATDADSCFQLLGLDVMLTERLQPVLLEANAHPSLALDATVPLGTGELPEGAKPCRCKDMAEPHFHQPSVVDEAIKVAVLAGALEIVRRERRGLDALGGPHASSTYVRIFQSAAKPQLAGAGEADQGPTVNFPVLDSLAEVLALQRGASRGAGLNAPKLRSMLEATGVLAPREFDLVLATLSGRCACAASVADEAPNDFLALAELLEEVAQRAYGSEIGAEEGVRRVVQALTERFRAP